MKRRRPSWWTGLDSLLALAFFALSAWFFAGFLFADPRLHNWEVRHSRMFTLLLRLGIYGAAIGLFFFTPLFYVAVRSRRLRGRSVAAFAGLVAVLMLALYLPTSVIYEEKMAIAEPLHPYLQLYPPDAPPSPKPADEYRVVCLGGSTTAWSAGDGKRWTELLEDRLRVELPTRNIRVINQGREWFTTQHSLINYETNVRQLQPDLVIVMHAINDFMVNADHSYYSSGPFRDDYGHHNGPLTRLSRNRSLLRFGAEVFRGVWYHQDREALDVSDFPGLQPYRRNLARLAQLTRLDGTQLVLMTQANLYKENYTEEEQGSLWLHTHNSVGPDRYWNLETAKRGMDQYNEALRAIASAENIPLVELDRTMPKTLEYLIDDCHYSSEAMELIADKASAVVGGSIRSTGT